MLLIVTTCYLLHNFANQITLLFIFRFNDRVVQLDASFRTFRNLPELQSRLEVEHLQKNLNKMLKNPVYGQNKIKMHLKISFPQISLKLQTFLKAHREQIVSLECKLYENLDRMPDDFWISYPNLEDLFLKTFEKNHGISLMLMNQYQSLQKLHIHGVTFHFIVICSIL